MSPAATVTVTAFGSNTSIELSLDVNAPMSDSDILIGIIGEYVILTVVGRCWVFGMVTKTNNRLCPNSRSNTVSLLENPNLINASSVKDSRWPVTISARRNLKMFSLSNWTPEFCASKASGMKSTTSRNNVFFLCTVAVLYLAVHTGLSPTFISDVENGLKRRVCAL